MRFKVLLRPNSKSLLIDWNYQQRLAAFIYNCLQKGNPSYAKDLHNGTMRVDNKPIKPFVFSWLNFPSGVKTTSSGLIPNVGLVEFFIASPDMQFVEALVNGLHGETLELGKETDYGVRTVELQPVPIFTDGKMVFRTMSPVVAPWIENPADKDHRVKKVFLLPGDPRFIRVLQKNLSRKYQMLYNELLSEDVDLILDHDFEGMKSKLVRFKKSCIKAFSIQLSINAPGKVLNLVYQAGLGSYNSQGFGMMEVVG